MCKTKRCFKVRRILKNFQMLLNWLKNSFRKKNKCEHKSFFKQEPPRRETDRQPVKFFQQTDIKQETAPATTKKGFCCC